LVGDDQQFVVLVTSRTHYIKETLNKVNFLLAINITIIDVDQPISIEEQSVLLQKP
jgi:hypothetical protein